MIRTESTGIGGKLTKYEKRIDKIITGEYDENIKERVREKAIHLKEEGYFQGLQLWLEVISFMVAIPSQALPEKWNSVNDLEKYLHEFKQHSLRNPIVEQMLPKH